jgi:hypothetical protein
VVAVGEPALAKLEGGVEEGDIEELDIAFPQVVQAAHQAKITIKEMKTSNVIIVYYPFLMAPRPPPSKMAKK